MAVITNLNYNPILPSDVFGYEVNTDVGYGRETFTLTLTAGQVAQVGSILKLDYKAKTATLAAKPADDAAVTALGDIGVFVGRDIGTNPATADDFDRLTAKVVGTQEVVAIVKGDGRGTVAKRYLRFADGSQFYTLTAAAQASMVAKLTKENRFKVQDQA